MSTSVLKALPGKLDIKRHSPSILYIKGHYKFPSAYMFLLIQKEILSNMQVHLSLCYSHTQSMDVDEDSDLNLDL